MKCIEIQRELQELAIDGERASVGRSPLFDHLFSCVDCSEAFDRERRTVVLIRELTEADVPEAERVTLRASVRGSIAAEWGVIRRRSRVRRLAVAATVAAIGLLLGLPAAGRFGRPQAGASSAESAARVDDGPTGELGPYDEVAVRENDESKRAGEMSRGRGSTSNRRTRRVGAAVRSAAVKRVDLGSVDSDSMMRFEFQSEDPAIRIIWFVPKAEDAASEAAEVGD